MKVNAGHLQYNWWKYLIVVILPLFLWISIFDVLARPKDHERLNILFLGDELDAASLQQTLEEYIPQHTQQKLKQIRVVSEYLPDEHYGQKMTTNSYEFDLIIVAQSFMRENTGQFFRRLPMDGLSGYESAKYYHEQVEGGDYSAPFGLVLWEPGVKNTFGEYYSGTEICYLFFSTESVNLYPLFEESKEGNNAAVVALDFLMKK